MADTRQWWKDLKEKEFKEDLFHFLFTEEERDVFCA